MGEVARMHPGRAVVDAVCALVVALLFGPMLAGVIGWILSPAFDSHGRFYVAVVLNLTLIPAIAAGFWWGALYGEIRGWWTSGPGDE